MRSIAGHRRLPSIRVLVAFAGLLLGLSLATAANHQLVEANTERTTARSAASRADELEGLLRLVPAVSGERNATGVSLGIDGLPDEIPAFVPAALGIDLDQSLGDTRAATDALLSGRHEEIAGSIEAVRADVDGGSLDLAATLAGYQEISDEITRQIESELLALSTAVAGGEVADLVKAAQVAEATASVQAKAGDVMSAWAQVISVPQATAGHTRQLAESLALLDHARSHVEVVLTDSATADRWQEYRQLDATLRFDTRLDATMTSLLVAGSPVVDDGTSDDPLMADPVELATILREIGGLLADDGESAAALSEVVEAALADVALAADEVEGEAAAGRRDVFALLALLVAAFVTWWLLLTRAIARPILRLGAVAEALRDGRLDERVEEAGPKELRSAASAFNEAIASLKLAETQAAALAEERLDDPVLATAVPGALGSSLRAAVRRLTTSMTEREEFQRRLAHEAAHDGLTKLPNRTAVLRHITAALARTRRASTSLALLFIDIDSFKSINDGHGHHVGDIVLRTIAQRLVASIREGDLAGRLSGDEFLVVAEPVGGIDDALGLSERIIAHLSEPIMADGVTVSPSASIGIALADNDLTADELIRDADLAVYKAKELGRGRIEICDSELRGQVVERAHLQQALAAAIDNDELTLHFQPIVDGKTRQLSSLEALVRWNRPGEGLLAPGAFIPVAERSDLIIDVDRWVLTAAVAQLATWGDHPVLGHVPVSVNVSGRHLSSGQLVQHVIETLEAWDMPGQRLIIEITETALLDDLGGAARDLARLRDLGVRIALDDFGTGYMSLAHLRSLPIDTLKIDRSFVVKLGSAADQSLIRLIVATGHLLGATVTAEGVESDDQVEMLTDMGSDSLQGFLFSRPLAPELIEQLATETGGLQRQVALSPAGPPATGAKRAGRG